MFVCCVMCGLKAKGNPQWGSGIISVVYTGSSGALF